MPPHAVGQSTTVTGSFLLTLYSQVTWIVGIFSNLRDSYLCALRFWSPLPVFSVCAPQGRRLLGTWDLSEIRWEVNPIEIAVLHRLYVFPWECFLLQHDSPFDSSFLFLTSFPPSFLLYFLPSLRLSPLIFTNIYFMPTCNWHCVKC